jgi:hypothetical protein
MSIRLESAARSAEPARAAPAPASPRPAATENPAFGELLEGVAARIDAGETLVRRALHGTNAGLDPAQWVALQAGIYRYVEAVDLAGKLVDRTGNAIRTVLSGNH